MSTALMVGQTALRTRLLLRFDANRSHGRIVHADGARDRHGTSIMPDLGQEPYPKQRRQYGPDAPDAFHGVRGDLLTKMGRFTEAREEIRRAITMTQNLREQELLKERLKKFPSRRRP